MSANFKPQRTAVVSRGFLAIARLSYLYCSNAYLIKTNVYFLQSDPLLCACSTVCLLQRLRTSPRLRSSSRPRHSWSNSLSSSWNTCLPVTAVSRYQETRCRIFRWETWSKWTTYWWWRLRFCWMRWTAEKCSHCPCFLCWYLTSAITWRSTIRITTSCRAITSTRNSSIARRRCAYLRYKKAFFRALKMPVFTFHPIRTIRYNTEISLENWQTPPFSLAHRN